MGVRILHNASIFLIVCLGVFYTYGVDVDLDQIKSQLPPELANTNLTLDDAKNLLKDKCKKVAGDDAAGESAYANIEAGGTELIECIQEIVNVTAIQSEIDKARPIGELDAVFNKYCFKRPQALDCINNFTKAVEQCFDEEEKKHSDVFMRIVTSLLNFVCHKGGDQIALFIAEKGPECLESNKEPIINCVNKTFIDYVPKNGVTELTSLPQFIMGPKQCNEMQELENCIVHALEQCEEITPANIVESMFRFIKNETMCKTETKSARRKSSNSSSTLPIVPITIFAGLMSITLLVKNLLY